MSAASPCRTHAAQRWSAAAIGRAATLALHDELALAPKPGLVSFVDSGSHDDMDAQTFMRSLFALHGYFVRIAELGAAGAPFAALERCGIEAEARMLAATGGINTHRGAIFMLGMLCAACAATQSAGQTTTAGTLRTALQQRWGHALAARKLRVSTLPGGIAARRHGLRSASQEAALGFPALFEVAVPAWARARRSGLDQARLHLQVFFEIMAVLDDANLAHRGGLDGLRHAREHARAFLATGGASSPQACQQAWRIHRDFVQRRLSPGGCADTLSAACFLERIGALG
ncbi:MAG: triphosphoribosyl-dephospho-CoA synthase [Burkholderiaceae bacterium]|nr:triphosphoribosyl-dephospho-CoA synthase [Burkholderiaceae bacterium]